MKIKIFSFGKPKYAFIQNGIDEYENRIKKMATFENIFLKESLVDTKNIIQSLIEEEKQILKFYKPNLNNYLLIENSTQFSSVDFAKDLEKNMHKKGPEFCFFIGSPYGFSDTIKKTFSNHLSLSKMTLTHDFARLLLLEQIYRAITIQKNIPYHN